MDKIELITGESGPVVDERLHSQFIEFLGACIAEGIWVGEDSEIPNIHGLRRDTVEALRELQPPVVRWPGGCFADTYHWRDGIGERAKRPVTYNNNFGTRSLEYNQFGTHEFMEFCRLIGAKPWFNGNVLSGSVGELREWAEYCNRGKGTALAEERAENGSAEPFGVEYWGIGNESWGGGGCYTAQGYAEEYRKYASAFPSFGTPEKPFSSGMKLIAVGPDGNKPQERVAWTKDFFEAFSQYRQPPLYGYDLHFYNWNIQDPEDRITAFSEEAWYRVISGCLELEDVIEEQYCLLQEGVSKIRRPEGWQVSGDNCRLVVGEWGNWHRPPEDAPSALWQQCTMRDAVTSALTLDIFHRNCGKVSIACAAQAVNVLNSVLLTFGDKTVKTPNYYVFQMYKEHRNAKAVKLNVTSETLFRGEKGKVESVFAFASCKAGKVTVNLVNPSYREEREVLLCFDSKAEYCSGQQLGGMDPTAHNTPEQPDAVSIQEAPSPAACEEGWRTVLPKASITVYQFRL